MSGGNKQLMLVKQLTHASSWAASPTLDCPLVLRDKVRAAPCRVAQVTVNFLVAEHKNRAGSRGNHGGRAFPKASEIFSLSI